AGGKAVSVNNRGRLPQPARNAGPAPLRSWARKAADRGRESTLRSRSAPARGARSAGRGPIAAAARPGHGGPELPEPPVAEAVVHLQQQAGAGQLHQPADVLLVRLDRGLGRLLLLPREPQIADRPLKGIPRGRGTGAAPAAGATGAARAPAARARPP